ncbi:Exoenzymes regulatory protein AepA precursor [Leucobacter sp. 7(1)]|uniref:amidohydrolase n=1 Tax=Leucobacter sp. 7(1) TaxID=1255613 RepID=UPI00097E966C|nr:amidohydrolase [Leucobacter sp. 7(1)]SJN11777.1 Exoenzymes regulatory protein AepA precursor [Leucobacter sp. 7(1)]
MQLDLIVRAREILTLDPARPIATALGVIGERIVGFDEEIAGVSALRELDFGAATVTPGLIDAHCHTAWWGLGLAAIDLSQARGLDELYAMVAAEAARLDAAGDPRAWLHGTGFNQSHHGGAFPDIARLDELTGERPLYLRHTSGHASITNTATLRLVGALETGFENPTGGVVVRDAAGDPTGLVEEAAQGLVQALLLPYATDALVAALDAATQRYAAEGITSFTEAGVGGGWIGHSPVEVAAYQAAAEQGRLHARAQLMPALDALRPLSGHAGDFHGTAAGAGLDLGIRAGFGDDRVRFGHVKVFLDGSLLGATAAVTEDYCGHEHNTGYLLDEPAVYRERALAAYRAGWPLALHAIGDAAIDLALDLISEAQERYGVLDVPCRIEHFGIARPDQLTRAGALGIAVTPQAGFIGPIGDQMADRVGPERASWLYRGRSVIDAGILLTGSSDLPVADNNLRRGMQSAVDRLTDSGAVLGPEEAITPEEALRTHTVWAAQATGQLASRGTLERGKLADLTVFSDSPLTAPSIAGLDIVATLLGGTLSYDSRG